MPSQEAVMKLLIFSYLFFVICALLFLLFQLIKLFFMRLTGEKIKIKDTYSFKWIPKLLLNSLLIASLLAVFIYWQTESLEISVSLYVLFVSCIFAGVIRSALTEYQAKRRGAQKIIQKELPNTKFK